MAKRILVVTTSNSNFEGPTPHPTGVWLSEFTEPYMEFHKAGVEMVVASPHGGQMPVAPRSLPTPDQEKEWQSAMTAAAKTVKLADVSSDNFDAIFLPGGHGPMFDLPDDFHLARLLESFFAEGKIIAAVCHGPVGLVGAKRPNGDPLVKGVTLTSYTYSEEVAAKLDKEVPFILEHRLRELGANFIARENKADHVERDLQFITGQNPNSSVSIARSLVAALNKSFQPVLNVVATDIVPTKTVAEFPVNTFIENIAISEAGQIFVSSLEEGRVYQIGSGAPVLVAQVEKAAGLAFDPRGKLLVGSSVGSKTPGIFRLDGGKASMAVPMPEAIFLNGLTHLSGSHNLVADAYRGLIWEVNVNASSCQVWIKHPALATNADPFHPVPQYFPGVNGIKLFGGYVYASSTQQQKLVRIPLHSDFSAGKLEVWMTNINVDDFAFDERGNIFGTTHVYNSVVRIDPERRITIVAGINEGMAGSTAVAFGRTSNDRTFLYVTTNGGMSLPPDGGVQPGRVVQLDVGVAGYWAKS
ncbi:MAG: DJ-1/PfpI family protein [Acidobacteriaceae bacterium]|nr:DJ-1/PfpI family protein [Acidobacteriaceae bacterium]